MPLLVKLGHWYVSKKWNWKFKKIGKLFNMLLFFIKISCRSKKSPLSKQYTFSLTPPIISSPPSAKLEEFNAPSKRKWIRTMNRVFALFSFAGRSFFFDDASSGFPNLAFLVSSYSVLSLFHVQIFFSFL